MKAHLKAILIHYVKSGNIIWTLLFIGLFIWQRQLSENPFIAAMFLFLHMAVITDYRNAAQKSGYRIYEKFDPVPVRERICAEYAVMAVTAALAAVLMYFGSPWTKNLFSLVPVLPLIIYGLELPWYYLDESLKASLAARAVTAVLAFAMMAGLRETSLVIRKYPLPAVIAVNLCIILFYILSAVLAVRFAEKRERGIGL